MSNKRELLLPKLKVLAKLAEEWLEAYHSELAAAADKDEFSMEELSGATYMLRQEACKADLMVASTLNNCPDDYVVTDVVEAYLSGPGEFNVGGHLDRAMSSVRTVKTFFDGLHASNLELQRKREMEESL